MEGMMATSVLVDMIDGVWMGSGGKGKRVLFWFSLLRVQSSLDIIKTQHLDLGLHLAGHRDSFIEKVPIRDAYHGSPNDPAPDLHYIHTSYFTSFDA
jgi:hypothetical protein